MVYLYIGYFADPKAGSRSLLARGLAELGYGPLELLHGEHGRPWLDGGPEISLSHTRGAAAAALSEDGPVGVDLEAVRPVRKGLPRRVLGPEEYAWYLSRGEAEADFFTLWTLKESWYKYLGTGLPGFPNQTEFYPDGDRWHLRGAEQHFWTGQKDLLFLALCSGEQEVSVRWVSET